MTLNVDSRVDRFSGPGWTAFAWARLIALLCVGLFLQLLALQSLFQALAVKDYVTTADTVYWVVEPFVAPIAAVVVLVVARHRGRGWLPSLRRAAWVFVLVGLYPAYAGGVSTII